MDALKAMTPVGGARESGLDSELRARSPEELVALFTNDVWRYVSSQSPCREDAEDVMMEVFAAALASFHRLADVSDHRLWLLGVARKKVADQRRRRYRRHEIPLEEEPLPVDAEASELRHLTRSALSDIPGVESQVLVLKYVNGLSTEEVARVIRRSVPATNSLLQRARGSFREALGPAFDQGATHEQS